MIGIRTSILALAATLVVLPSAFGGLIYDNGTPSSTTGLNFDIGYDPTMQAYPTVSDTFTISSSSVLQFIDVALWFPGSGVSTLTYCISANAKCSGTVFDSASGTQLTAEGSAIASTVYNSTNYTLEEFQFNVQQKTYVSGTYWLTLSNANGTATSIFWDQTGGVGCLTAGCPSGAVYSEAEIPIAIQGTGGVTNRSEALDIYSTPEPSSLLLGAGGLLLAGILRRKRR